MTKEEIISKACTIIADHLGLDESDVTPEKRLVEDLGADSLDLAEEIMTLENEFGISIPDEDVEGIETVQDIYDMIERIIK